VVTAEAARTPAEPFGAKCLKAYGAFSHRDPVGTPITTDGRGTAAWRRLGDHVAHDVLARRPERAGDLGLDALCVVVFGALAGVAIGLWTGGPHVLYVATKVPLLFGGTLLIGFPSMLVLGRLIGCPLSAEQAARLSLTTIARTATVLGGLAPASACFTLSLARAAPARRVRRTRSSPPVRRSGSR
jgi:hypothetical protein